MRRDGVTASSRKYSISPCRSSWNIGFDERTKIRMHGERVSLLALTIARKKVFVSSTVSRPNNSARRTPRSRVILYAIALEERAALAALVHQLVRVLVGILDHVVVVAVVDHLHHRPCLPGKVRGSHLTSGLQRCSPGYRSRPSELRRSGRRAGA